MNFDDLYICLLSDTEEPSDNPGPDDDWPTDPRPFLPEARWEWHTLENGAAVTRLIELSRKGFDLYFNLCDGAWDEDRPGIEVIQTLERLGVPYTGADTTFYEPSREAMKRVCRARGIDTPEYVMARNDQDMDRAAATLAFPLFVKHPNSYASVGLTPESRVTTREALHEQAQIMITAYGAALIEEFIEGREFTVLVAENPDDDTRPITYTPVEFLFPEGESFKHEQLKWVDYHLMATRAVEDAVLGGRLRTISARFFLGLNGAGYGRCDIRMDARGRLHMLEINANCGLYYTEEDAGSADFALLNDPAGHDGFTRTIVEAALRRHARSQPAWEVRPNGNGDHGIYATRGIRPGEPIIRFEEQPHVLVSRSHVERNWREPERSWFPRYAWPLTDDIWVTWSRDPEEWLPINHSCEPNAWLEGLDLVARFELRPGDEVTVDYATFYNEVMPSFECHCGSDNCRGVVRGGDYLRDFVGRYGDHVSDYVKRRRRENGQGSG